MVVSKVNHLDLKLKTRQNFGVKRMVNFRQGIAQQNSIVNYFNVHNVHGDNKDVIEKPDAQRIPSLLNHVPLLSRDVQ